MDAKLRIEVDNASHESDWRNLWDVSNVQNKKVDKSECNEPAKILEKLNELAKRSPFYIIYRQ